MWYDVTVQRFREICAFPLLDFMFVILITKVSVIPVLGATALVAPFILGGSDGRDVGCGLAAPMEIRFLPPRKSKHSQSAVSAVHPRSPTAALKPI